MPSYNHNFIYNVVFNSIDKNGKNQATIRTRHGDSRSNEQIGNTESRKEESDKGAEEARETATENRHSKADYSRTGRRIRTSKRSILQSERSKKDSKVSKLRTFTLFIFYIDLLDSCPSYALYCLSNMIQTLINPRVYR